MKKTEFNIEKYRQKILDDIENESLIDIEEKEICKYCKNDSFRVYIKVIIDDARLFCSKCGKAAF